MRFSVLLVGLAVGLAPLAAPIPAYAQSDVAPEGSVFDGDYLMVGIGAAYGPSYEGSDDYIVSPIPAVLGKIRGIEITPRKGGIALDLIPDGQDPKIGFSFGPVASYSSKRHSHIKDPVVRAAGKLKESIDLGVNGGVTFYKLLNAYDSVTVSADVEWNANSASRGMIVTPGINYITPLSRAALVTVRLDAKHVDDDYANYYYSVSPAQSIASGLPAFQAKGGWASAGASALIGYDLDGDLLNGGLVLFVGANYERLMEDAKRTPYTAIRGSADQWTVGTGLAYTF